MSKYYLWLGEIKSGPYSAEAIGRMLRLGRITGETLWSMDGGADEWARVKDCPAFNIPAPPEAESCRRPSIAPGPDADTITARGREFVAAGKWLGRLAIAVAGVSLIAAVGVFMSSLEQSSAPMRGPLFAAGCAGLATWLYLIGQVMLIRAALERRR